MIKCSHVMQRMKLINRIYLTLLFTFSFKVNEGSFDH